MFSNLGYVLWYMWGILMIPHSCSVFLWFLFSLFMISVQSFCDLFSVGGLSGGPGESDILRDVPAGEGGGTCRRIWREIQSGQTRIRIFFRYSFYHLLIRLSCFSTHFCVLWHTKARITKSQKLSYVTFWNINNCAVNFLVFCQKRM